jgi:hypothetical protein
MTTQHLQSDVKKRFGFYSDSTQQKHKYENWTQLQTPERRNKLQNVETNSRTSNQTPERRNKLRNVESNSRTSNETPGRRNKLQNVETNSRTSKQTPERQNKLQNVDELHRNHLKCLDVLTKPWSEHQNQNIETC